MDFAQALAANEQQQMAFLRPSHGNHLYLQTVCALYMEGKSEAVRNEAAKLVEKLAIHIVHAGQGDKASRESLEREHDYLFRFSRGAIREVQNDDHIGIGSIIFPSPFKSSGNMEDTMHLSFLEENGLAGRVHNNSIRVLVTTGSKPDAMGFRETAVYKTFTLPLDTASLEHIKRSIENDTSGAFNLHSEASKKSLYCLTPAGRAVLMMLDKIFGPSNEQRRIVALAGQASAERHPFQIRK
ncbi:MAG: hypothetical protein EBQ96_05270 [Proteobacteria bacterium]|nr:hypothetical protein [Pseudomonadota bacterium]